MWRLCEAFSLCKYVSTNHSEGIAVRLMKRKSRVQVSRGRQPPSVQCEQSQNSQREGLRDKNPRYKMDEKKQNSTKTAHAVAAGRTVDA